MVQQKVVHILRYGTVAEKVHLEKAISAYDYLSINGNTAAYVSSAISKFIVAKFFSKPEKGFFIDPITYAFQNNIKLLWTTSKTTGERSIKKSVQKLLEIYKGPVYKVRTGSPVTINDFSSPDVKESFCRSVLSFQYNLVYDHIQQNDLQKYLDYVDAGHSKNIAQLRPKFLIAPYFYVDNQDPLWEEWLSLNIHFAKISKQMSEHEYNEAPVFCQIVISKALLLDDAAISEVVSAYKQVECDGYTIWVDDLNEHNAEYSELYGFMHLLEGLQGKPVYNMYGGFFSILLTHKSVNLLKGVSHGLEYGESRKVYPVGGGIPVSKYYYYPLHQRIDFTKAFYLLANSGVIDIRKENWGSSKQYFEEICRCEQCKKLLQDDMINFVEFESQDFYEVHTKNQVIRRKKASSDTKANCLYHYLLCKKTEFRLMKTVALSKILQDLESDREEYVKWGAVTAAELKYIEVWCQLLHSKNME